MFSYRTREKRAILVLLLAVMMVASMDSEDLDDNVVVKMMVGFARMINLTSVMVCLSTLKSAEDHLLIFVQDINITLALELTWE